MTLRVKIAGLCVSLALACAGAGGALASKLKSDEAIIFFPTAAHLDASDGHWVVPLHAWVFEPVHESLLLDSTLNALAWTLEIEDDVRRSEIFRDRARWFLVDNERGKTVVVDGFTGQSVGQSGPDGHIESTLRFKSPGMADGTWQPYKADMRLTGGRLFHGAAQFVRPEGVSVVSDIDDTIKISEVTDKKKLLENTFLKPFRAAPGMAAAYQRLSARGAVFHYVSSSPWQLFPPLRDFMSGADFPGGSFHLRRFRLKDESFFKFLQSSEHSKPPVIAELLARWPKRQFILIGDSGEHDPEIYAGIARANPGRIRHIYIRDVTGQDAGDARYAQSFAGLPEGSWTVFTDASVIAAPDVTEEKPETRTGTLPGDTVLQHPVAPSIDGSPKRNHYLDIREDGKVVGQIVVIYGDGVEPPTEHGRMIELTGAVQKVELGGPPGTKGEYRGEVIHVKSWRYVD